MQRRRRKLIPAGPEAGSLSSASYQKDSEGLWMTMASMGHVGRFCRARLTRRRSLPAVADKALYALMWGGTPLTSWNCR